MNMKRETVDPFVTAHHVANFHEMVIDYHSQMVGGNPIGLHDDRILKLGVTKGDVTANFVVDRNVALKRQFDSYRVAFAASSTLGRCAGIKPATMAIISGKIFLLPRFPYSFQSLRRAEAVIGLSAVNKHLTMLMVNIEALSLDVGTIVTANFRALIPLQAKIPQAVKEPGHGLGIISFPVGILYPQNKFPAVMAGKKIIE
jgi:hypothetical protein